MAVADRELARFSEDCAAEGLDLVHPFRGEGDRLGLLVANTRALWPAFERALREGRADPDAVRPLDEHVERVLTLAAAGFSCSTEVRFAHVPPYIPIQQLAHRTGFAFLSRTNLCIHPTYGPWIALRAVVTCDREAPPPGPPAKDPCQDCRCGDLLQQAMARPDDWRSWLAVRDGCTVGRAHRYSEAQIAYHYTKDRSILRR